MENFVVSARKYRPSTFDSVVGQKHITTTLKNAINSKHLAQAFLFCGPRGVGKTTCARILAKTINCQNLTPETEACNECESCRSFNTNSSFNIHELDAASNNSVDDIRNLVEQVRYAPQTGKYKIYIIDEVHMLSNAAFNAFLKTLEEPPSYAIFILATTERHKIIPTILSRCQIFDFNRIRVEDMVNHLGGIAQKEEITAEPDALHLISQKADGALRDALSIFDQQVTFSGNHLTYKGVVENLHVLDYDYYFKLTDYLLAQNLPQSLLLFDEILKNGFDAHNFIIGIAEHFRSLLVCKDNATVQLLEVSDNVKAKYADQANRSSLSFLLSGLNVVSQCDINYKSSKNQRLHVELCLMKLAYLNDALNFAQSGASNGEAKKKTDGGSITVPAPAPQPAATPQRPAAAVPVSAPAASNPAPVAPAMPKPAPATAVAEAPQPAVSKASLPPKKSLGKLPSLKDIGKPQAAAAETAVAEEEETVPAGAFAPLNPEQLQAEWRKIVLRKKEDNMMEYMILNRPYHLRDNNEILLEVENMVMVEQFNSLRPVVLSELRQQLNNRSIQLSVEIKAADPNQKMLYTAQDKFNHLVEKYPLLNDLRQKLGLDMDF